MAPGAARAPATAGGAVAATASPPRDDAAPTPQPATAAPLDGARVQAAWRQVQPRLADPECLGMLADVLERGEPRIGYDPQRGKVVLRLAVANLYWGQLSDRRTQARLAQILGEALGLEGPAPLELERAERAPQAAASGSAAEDGVEQEPIVRFAARELDARRLNR
ncbi:MAG: hypothetical protein D6731_14590 [Planctomycetota bacterium]|nr:MAG: hypothetical protein D6731_14590 [Planctomycetota bacterium]